MKSLKTQLEFIQLFSEETLASMELRGVIGGEGSSITDFICGGGGDCGGIDEHCTCPTTPPIKAVALDCGNGSFKFACDFTPH